MNQSIASDRSPPRSAEPRSTPVARQPAPAHAISVEIRRLSSCGDIRPQWSDLAGRALARNVFFEPDFMLAATHHLVAFRDAIGLLAWQGSQGEPGRRLLGLIPCFPRSGLFVPDDLVGFSDERIADGTPLLDAQHAQAVIAAVMGLRQGWQLAGRGLLLRRLDLDGPLLPPILRAAEERGLSAALRPIRPIPAATLPDGHENVKGLVLREATTRGDIRDAVEILLALDASGERGWEGTAVLHNTREVGFLRAMTRELAGQRQCRVALLHIDEAPIAAALILGRQRRGFLYLAAQDEAHLALAPQQTLLAMLARNAPQRPILTSGFGELRLSPQEALRPRDLAGRAREAFRRGLKLDFRLGPAARA